MNNQGETLSENEAAPIYQRYGPRDFKDLTGHNYPTIPPDFKPVLTMPWTERPDQGISNLPEDLTVIERFTTITRPEQSIFTSAPRRLTAGTEIEIITIIDGTKFIPPSSTSDVTTLGQGSENTSPKETTDVPRLSTETTLLSSSFIHRVKRALGLHHTQPPQAQNFYHPPLPQLPPKHQLYQMPK
jgi:hypothetical protein